MLLNYFIHVDSGPAFERISTLPPIDIKNDYLTDFLIKNNCMLEIDDIPENPTIFLKMGPLCRISNPIQMRKHLDRIPSTDYESIINIDYDVDLPYSKFEYDFEHKKDVQCAILS